MSSECVPASRSTLALDQLSDWARSRVQSAPLDIPSSAIEHIVDLRGVGAAGPAALKEWVANALQQNSELLRLRPIAAVNTAAHHVTHTADGKN